MGVGNIIFWFQLEICFKILCHLSVADLFLRQHIICAFDSIGYHKFSLLAPEKIPLDVEWFFFFFFDTLRVCLD